MFLITTVIVGLVRYAWFGQDKRIRDLETCKLELNKKGGPLSLLGHQEICGNVAREGDEEMTEVMKNFEKWLGLRLDSMQKDIQNLSERIEDRVENRILKELQKLNRSA
jgi:histidinol dehydrogenase